MKGNFVIAGIEYLSIGECLNTEIHFNESGFSTQVLLENG